MSILRFFAPIDIFLALLVTCLGPLTFASQKGMPMKIVDQLNQIETDFNIDYEVDPKYYDNPSIPTNIFAKIPGTLELFAKNSIKRVVSLAMPTMRYQEFYTRIRIELNMSKMLLKNGS